MRLVSFLLASVVMSGPACACMLDGEMGMHRFNPFLAHQSSASFNRYAAMEDSFANDAADDAADDDASVEQENAVEDQRMASSGAENMQE